MESLGNVDLRGTVLPGSAWFVLGVVRSGHGSAVVSFRHFYVVVWPLRFVILDRRWVC